MFAILVIPNTFFACFSPDMNNRLFFRRIFVTAFPVIHFLPPNIISSKLSGRILSSRSINKCMTAIIRNVRELSHIRKSETNRHTLVKPPSIGGRISTNTGEIIDNRINVKIVFFIPSPP
jgi:hypothetical protein